MRRLLTLCAALLQVTLPPVPLTDEVKQSSVTMLASDVFSKAQLMNWHEKVYGTQMGDKSKQWLAEHIVERYANDVRTLLNCQHVGKALLELYLVKHCGQNTKNLNKADMVDRVLDILQQPSRQEVDPGSGYEVRLRILDALSGKHTCSPAFMHPALYLYGWCSVLHIHALAGTAV